VPVLEELAGGEGCPRPEPGGDKAPPPISSLRRAPLAPAWESLPLPPTPGPPIVRCLW
jgi:hypothetical protein